MAFGMCGVCELLAADRGVGFRTRSEPDFRIVYTAAPMLLCILVV